MRPNELVALISAAFSDQREEDEERKLRKRIFQVEAFASHSADLIEELEARVAELEGTTDELVASEKLEDTPPSA